MADCPDLQMMPAPGRRLALHVGDRVRFDLAPAGPDGAHAFVRTTLGRDAQVRAEAQAPATHRRALAGAAWRDVPMRRTAAGWSIDLTCTEPGFFLGKPYLIDADGTTHWPAGADVGLAVHSGRWRSGNTIYCAFPRLFGPLRNRADTADRLVADQLAVLDRHGYTVIPASGTLRDVAQAVPHIVERLGCRILHLLPVNPTPTVNARMGRYGSPYAGLDLTGIDPALVVFDRRTTGIDQFRELAYTVHRHDARLFIDLAINHTGWLSRLQEEHPEWFARNADGTFRSPGAWGTTWEDLVEIDHQHRPDLWDHLAQAFLTWCRRGVDGFRCDAGYMVPVEAWRVITSRVREEFPDTVFLLEGLGGAWSATEALLTDGGLQWAYSELFQNYSGREVAAYLDHALVQNRRCGLLVHYSETHDNNRLAASGRVWSLLRNRLCGLASERGAFGFTCGVEWLATEKVDVHQARGLNWDARIHLCDELGALNRLLQDHPCFHDSAQIRRLSEADSTVLVFERRAADGETVLVIINTDHTAAHNLILDPVTAGTLGAHPRDLLGQALPPMHLRKDGHAIYTLPAGFCACIAPSGVDHRGEGRAYRAARDRHDLAIRALATRCEPEAIGDGDWTALAALVDRDPAGLLAAISRAPAEGLARDPAAALEQAMAEDAWRNVTAWSPEDQRRITPLPHGHWLLCADQQPFRADLDDGRRQLHLRSTPTAIGHVAVVPPGALSGDIRLSMERYGQAPLLVQAELRALPAEPVCTTCSDGQGVLLLTNGLGGMARLHEDLGRIASKYDCALGANLHPRWPVDRHVFVKRVRAWLVTDGFSMPIDGQSLVCTEPGPPAVWRFSVAACDGRCVPLRLEAVMPAGADATVLRFVRERQGGAGERVVADTAHVRLVLRPDLEDRSFHTETHLDPVAEAHFRSAIKPSPSGAAFTFAPGADRRLAVTCHGGRYHPDVEWVRGQAHPIEASRGLPAEGDAYSPGWFEAALAPGGEAVLVLDATPDATIGHAAAVAAFDATRQRCREIEALAGGDHPFTRRLARAADAYVARRDGGSTVIAGYPWFLDWGRDTLICGRGLLAAGRSEAVVDLLRTFGRYVHQGTLPNCIHGEDVSNRDTTDAPLWYAVLAEDAAARLGDGLWRETVIPGGATVAEVLGAIAAGYRDGTPNGIAIAPDEGLVWSPSHFTWMDTNHPAGSPREGYPIEIQALWLRLLRRCATLGLHAGKGRPTWADLAERVGNAIAQRFWRSERPWLVDCLLCQRPLPPAQAVADTALRPNALLAIALGAIGGAAARRTVEHAARHLLVPGAVRSLAPLRVDVPLPVFDRGGRLLNNPEFPYWGRYQGDEDTSRKPAYHNGTAWGWLLPVFCEALVRAWPGDTRALATARSCLASTARLFDAGCRGHLPEIIDGDAPHQPRGCDAQAWSVTEALRVWKLLEADPTPA